ncbi:MAG TPA: DUF4956 domain-containing protein [Gemmatimonadales bacterium]|jgi:hypothetical protein|nr:DUF4956 domain-containing protein [Gemmatimonadales bacterium]
MALASSIERLAARLGVESGNRRIGRTTLLRLTLYYLVVIIVISAFILLTGEMRPGFESSGDASRVLTDGLSGNAQLHQLTQGFWAPLFRTLPPLAYGAASVIGSFLLSLPVAFTYVRTRNRLKYDQSLVQTVIMLPVVVTAILIVVENSLALAFSLAGIVAAIRFRSNLKDNRDAVYILVAVGIGFASGVGTLAIATFLSMFFCTLELLLWKLDLTADHERTFGMLCMPAGVGFDPALPAGTGTGDADIGLPSADTNLLQMGGATPEVGQARAKKSERLLIYVTDPEKGREVADEILGRDAKQFKFRKAKDGGNDQYVLDYRIRCRKKTPSNRIIEGLYATGSPYVIAAEVKEADG